ncbi:MAG TPA: glycosyltransferase family 1 protein [Candidatus Paceibacterota bacterium]|nr:glycosyltransferase family 1 protein [Candidatus Paceibacterota bacterium]
MSKKIRIGFMTHTIDGRKAKGTAVVARKYVEALLRHRDEFDITFVHYEKTDDPIYTHGVREVILPTFWPKFFNRHSLRQTWYFFTTKDRYDIFHWGQPRLYPFFWYVPAKHLVVATHGADTAKAEPFNFMVLVFKWMLILYRKRVDISIAASDFAKGEIERFYGFKPSQVRTITNGVEPMFVPASAEAVAAVKKKYKLPEKFFLNVARLNPGKNAFRVIRAYDLFMRTHPEADISFVNIGADGFEKKEVFEFLDKSAYKDRITLVEYIEQDDLPALYTAAYALVFPLLNDGFGLPLLEAMACGTPTAASDTALPEITSEEAILVNAFSEEDIAKAMETLLTDQNLRAKLIRNGFEKARASTWEAVGEKIIAIYKELAARDQ